jgi:hypothetical protein
MRTVSFYHRDTGLLNGSHVIASDDNAVALNTPPDHIAIDGHHDQWTKCVDLATGEVVDYTPPAPSSEALAAQAKTDRRAAALAAIARLEAAQPRAVREAILDPLGSSGRLRSINDQIAALRGDL